MTDLIILPWTKKYIEFFQKLQNENGLPLLSPLDEIEYFDEYNPQDWFILATKSGQPVAGVRHFPHFSAESWMQLLLDSNVQESDKQRLIEYFLEKANLEEASGFRLVIAQSLPDLDKKQLNSLSNFSFLEQLKFVFENERTWSAYEVSLFKNIQVTSKWKEPQGFQVAMMLSEKQNFEEDQELSPFQEKARAWHSVQDLNVSLRYEQRGENLLILASNIKDPKLFSEAVISLSLMLKVKTVWTFETLNGSTAHKKMSEYLFTYVH